MDDIKVLQQQKIINEEIRVKFEIENNKLRENLIEINQKIIEQIKKNKIKNKNIKFLELNLMYGHKCRKSFFKPMLYDFNTEEYRACVLNKGLKKTR